MKIKKNDSKFLLLTWLAMLVLFVSNACQNENPYTQGKILYENFCSNCHMDDGTGLINIIPPLAGADYLQINQDKLPCIIRAGMKGNVVVNGKIYSTEMPGVPQLTEFEVTNVINYINSAWGNNYGVVKHLEVREALNSCE